MNRRTAIKGVATVTAAAVFRVEAGRIEALYRRWQEELAAFGRTGSDANYRNLTALEDQIMTEEPQSLRDMAFKILTADNHGDMSVNTTQVALVREARRIVGAKT